MKSSYKLLYAEDVDEVRVQYGEFFKNFFENVNMVKDGQEAYEYYCNEKPEIVILDVNMPKINGLKVADFIRNKHSDKDTKIIILSSLSGKSELLKAIELNLVKYLVKPVILSDLESMIKAVIKELDNEKNRDSIIKINSEISYDLKEQTIYKNKQPIKLTKNQMLLMELLSSSKKIFKTDEILNYVWSDEHQSEYNPNKVRILCLRIKKKLNSDIIESVYGIGYRLRVEN